MKDRTALTPGVLSRRFFAGAFLALAAGLLTRSLARATEFEITATSFTVDNQLNVSSAAYFGALTAAPPSPSASQIDEDGQALSGGLYFDGTHYNVWLPGQSQWVQLSTGAAGSTPPGGLSNQIQFNDAGAFGGSADLTYTGNALAIGGGGNVSVGGVLISTGIQTPSGALFISTSVTLAAGMYFNGDMNAGNIQGQLAVANGGTGVGTLAADGILYGNATGDVGVTAVGTSGQVLTSNGAGNAPTWQPISGVLSGGTPNAMPYWSSSTGLGTLALMGNGGLIIGATGVAPSTGTLVGLGPVSVTNGPGTISIGLTTVNVSSGGTGVASLAAGDLLYGEGTLPMTPLAPTNYGVLTANAGAPAWTAAGTAGTVLAGNAGSVPTWQSISSLISGAGGNWWTNPAGTSVIELSGVTVGESTNVVVQTTMTIEGNAFSVGGSTFVVASGHVGIGTLTPGSYRLNVNGNDSIGGSESVTQSVSADSAAFTASAIVGPTATADMLQVGAAPSSIAGTPASASILGLQMAAEGGGQTWLYDNGGLTIAKIK